MEGVLLRPGHSGMAVLCRARASPRKNAANNLLNRDFLDIDVADGQFVEQGFADGNDAVAFYFELYAAGIFFDDFAIFTEISGPAIGAPFAVDGNELEIRKPVQHLAQ